MIRKNELQKEINRIKYQLKLDNFKITPCTISERIDKLEQQLDMVIEYLDVVEHVPDNRKYYVKKK